MDYVIAIDLGGTQLRVALVRADGQLVAHERCATLVAEGPEAVTQRMLALIAQVRQALPLGQTLRGIGIGAPGPLDPTTGIIYAPPNMPGWDAFPLQARIAAATGLPVALGNDANVAALAEWRFGGGRGLRHLVYVTVSTGIGGGVIMDGQLLLGRLGAGGELGFMLLDPINGAIWEDLASGTALGRAAASAMAHDTTSHLHQLATPASVTAAHVAQAAAQGDVLASQLMAREGHLLGLGFASILHLFSPELLLVGGGVILNNPALLATAREVAYAHVKVPLYRDTPISAATLGEAVGVLGAAALAFGR
ncbi:MAG: ROK family protein [Candidatus Viridilinea halotolerans]|uniref:ROK family protein n=1 Tax=Candidatus Viridilinea halotolerans TaxID=2491704 RepID=A0A426U498_9CHLR|nr:MAG: ROK family protein [Candidatus Viridilinea halotolerans]